MPAFPTRIGINTGSVIVGNFGTANRMNFSALGDPVNTAARLQGLGKVYGTKIIIGEATYELIKPHFLVRLLDIVEIRGRTTTSKIYELMAAYNADPSISPTSELNLLAEQFTKAVTLFHSGAKEEARAIFEELHRQFPDDAPTKRYLDDAKT